MKHVNICGLETSLCNQSLVKRKILTKKWVLNILNILCRTSGSHRRGLEEFYQDYKTEQSIESQATFMRNILPPSLRLNSKPSKKIAKIRQSACCLFHAGFLLGLFFNLEDGGSTFLWKVTWLSTEYTLLHPEDNSYYPDSLNTIWVFMKYKVIIMSHHGSK
jgi:hypothetical protein